MKFIKSAFLVFISAILFLISVCLVLGGLMALDQQLTARIIHAITKADMPIAYIIGGLFAFVASLIVYNLTGSAPDSSTTYTFEGEKGPIRISLRAIEDYISRYFADKPVVNSIRPRVSTSRDRKTLRVRASISVWSEQHLRNAGETVQEEVTSCLKEGLGLDNIGDVLISVDKIIVSKPSKPAAPKAFPDDLP
jgi:hypothetical protein